MADKILVNEFTVQSSINGNDLIIKIYGDGQFINERVCVLLPGGQTVKEWETNTLSEANTFGILNPENTKVYQKIKTPPPSTTTPQPTRPPTPNQPPNTPPPTQTLPPIPPSIKTANQRAGKTTGKGLEGIITSISKTLAKLEKGVDDIYYGNKAKNTGIKLPGSKLKVNGVLPLVQEISKFDLCNVLTYATSKTNLTSITGADTVAGRKLKAFQDKAKNLSKQLDEGFLKSNSTKDPSRLSKINEALGDIVGDIDSDTVALLPQLANTKNYIDDVRGTLSTFIPQSSPSGISIQFKNLNTIPNSEVQKILNKLRGIQSTLYSVSNIRSIQDVLNVANNAAGVNIANQLKELQKIVDPSKLLPAFKQVANVLNGLNQIVLKVLNFVKILQVIGKVTQVLTRVLNVITKVLSLVPIPNIATVVTITQKFSDALQRIKKLIEDVLKRIIEIQSLVELIYSFIIDLSAKIQELKNLVNIIIFNLQSCANLDSSTSEPVIAELQAGISRIDSGISRLNTFAESYATATRNSAQGNEITFNGYVLRIVEEDLTETTIRNKRRKAIALDQRGVLVAETDLTFATDKYTLYEELKLRLKNQGLVSDTGAVGEGALAGLLAADVTEPYTPESSLINEQELIQTSAAVTTEVSNFIKGIKKRGRRFRRRIRQITAKFAKTSAQALKQAAKSGNLKPTTSSNKFAGSFGRVPKISQGAREADRPSPDLLTSSQRTRWQSVARSPFANPALRAKARNILEKDRQAQEE